MSVQLAQVTHRARLFPLPLPPPVLRPPSLNSAHGRFRFKMRLAKYSLAARCICALNRLYSPPPHRFLKNSILSQPFSFQPDKTIYSCSCCAFSDSPSAAQSRVLARVLEQCANFVLKARAYSHSTGCDMSTSFKAFIKSIKLGAGLPDDLELLPQASYSSPQAAVVPLVASRISLPSKLNIIPMLSVLPKQVADTYTEKSASDLLQSDMDVFLLNAARPLKPARVAGTRSEYIALIKRLKCVGMLAFTAKPKSVNGVFAVTKDVDSDRLIIDAQPANRLFNAPPAVALPGPSHIVHLTVPRGERMYVGKSDLSNFYHHIGLPSWMQPYFCLPPLSPKELCSIGILNGMPYPMCVTLPMGFSHAVYIAQCVHEHILYTMSSACLKKNILHLTSPLVPCDDAVHGVVIDDFFIFSRNKKVAEEQLRSVLAAYREAGFVVKENKVVMPTSSPVKVIGLTVDGRAATVTLPLESQLSLTRSTLILMNQKEVTGLTLAHIIGRWTWWMMVCRPSLAILQHSYRFCQMAQHRKFTLWFSVRRELSSLLAIAPLLCARLDSPIFHRAVASDASELGAGVVTTLVSEPLMASLWPLCSNRHHAYVQTLLSAAERRTLRHRVSPLRSSPLPAFNSYYSSISSSRWTAVISSPWKGEEHINVLELRAALLAAHWSLSYRNSINSRMFMLLDSTVAFFSIWKGRSSSPKLLLVLRKLSALCMASGLQLLLGWVPTELNPADSASRLNKCRPH